MKIKAICIVDPKSFPKVQELDTEGLHPLAIAKDYARTHGYTLIGVAVTKDGKTTYHNLKG